MSDSPDRPTPPGGSVPPPRAPASTSERPPVGAGFRPSQPPRSASQPPPPREPPPPPEPNPRHSRPPEGGRRDEERSPFERILPELLKRGLEASRGTIGNVSDTLFSRDLANSVVSQLGDMREGLVSAVAQEVGRFLRQADIAAEIRNVLTGMEVEAHVKIKFRKSEDGGITTQVEVEDPPKKSKRWL